MRTRLRGKISLLFVVFAVLLAVPATVALADVVKNDVQVTGVGQNREYEAGDPATTIGYYIQQAGDCDPANDTSATLNIKVSSFPSEAAASDVIMSDDSLTFTQCGVENKQNVDFSTAADAPRGDYQITVSVTDAGEAATKNPDAYNESPATFVLRVIDNCDGNDLSGSDTDGSCVDPNAGGGGDPQDPPANQPPTADAGGPYRVDEGSSTPLDGTGTDPDGDTVTYAWDLDNDGQYDDSTSEDPTFDAANLDGPSTHTVGLQVSDGSLTGTDTATVQVDNVPPTITSLVPSSQNMLSGTANNVTFTGSLTDPAPADTHKWQWSVDGGTLGAFGATGINTFTTSFSTCGSHYVSAKAQDDDLGLSDLYGTSANASVQVYDGSFRPPLADGSINKVQKGQVVPVKITAGCGANLLTGLSPSIQLLNGNVSPETESGATTVTTSVSSADSTGVMRPVDGGYIYNLRVPDNATANQLFTLRVNPFGAGANNAASGMYTVLQIRK